MATLPGAFGLRNWTGCRNGAATGRPPPESRREPERRGSGQRGGVERGVAARLGDAGGVAQESAPRNRRRAAAARVPRCPVRRSARGYSTGDTGLTATGRLRRRRALDRRYRLRQADPWFHRAGARRRQAGEARCRRTRRSVATCRHGRTLPVRGLSLKLGQAVERLERRQRVEVERAELHPSSDAGAPAPPKSASWPGSRAASGGRPARRDARPRACRGSRCAPAHHASRQAGELGDVDPVGAIGPARLEPVEEDDRVARLPHGDVEVPGMLRAARAAASARGSGWRTWSCSRPGRAGAR